MALINCPECGKEYSDTSESCPHCGYTEYEEEYITEGILSIIIGIASWIILFYINKGLLLIIPFIMFCVSIVLEKKCFKKFSLIGFFISCLGLAFLIIDFAKNILFLIKWG